jgi:hypothetical protein
MIAPASKVPGYVIVSLRAKGSLQCSGSSCTLYEVQGTHTSAPMSELHSCSLSLAVALFVLATDTMIDVTPITLLCKLEHVKDYHGKDYIIHF